MKKSAIKANSIANVPTYLQVAEKLRLNIAFCAAHGRAKTAMINQYAQENGYELITIILSRLLPEDMVGLPTTKVVDGKTITIYSNPDWLEAACDPKRKILLFFDEFNNAQPDVQASILSLIEDRAMGGLTLNDTTLITAAFNPLDIAPDGRELSKATRDRLCVIPIIDHSNVYADYYKSQNYNELADLFTEIPEIVENYDSSVIDTAYENAEFTYRSIEKSYKIVEYCVKNNISQVIINDLVSGYGGKKGKIFAKFVMSKISNNKKDEEIITILNNSKNIDEFINTVNTTTIMDNYKNYVDMRAIVNKIEQAINNEEDFKKFVANCLTAEFAARYKLEKVENTVRI